MPRLILEIASLVPYGLGRPLSFFNRLLYRLFGEIMIGGLRSFPTMTFPLQEGSHGMR
jgi:hypothetical protein